MGPLLSELKKFGRAFTSWQAGVLAFVVMVVAVFYGVMKPAAPDFIRIDGVTLPQYTTLTSTFVRSLSPWLLGATVLMFISFRLTRALASNSARKKRNGDAESGTSAVEFVLILPALTVLLLMIFQIALIVQAKFVVNYAAFCAARSAIVVIPDSLMDGGNREPHNQLGNPDTSAKVEIVQRAAALPLTSISPLPGLTEARGLPVLRNPDALVELAKLAPFDVYPRSMLGQAMLRAPYAYLEDNTSVKVLTQQGTQQGAFKEHDWVTVKVRYRYYLTVPFVNKLFGTAYSGNPISNLIFGAEYYYPIVEQYTLPMDGESTTP
jgi:hypothetical protein